MSNSDSTIDPRAARSVTMPSIPTHTPQQLVVMCVGRAALLNRVRDALEGWSAVAPPLSERADPATHVDGDTIAQSSPPANIDEAEGGMAETGPALILHTFTSQKAVLQEIRANPPQAVLIEVDAKPESRVRFCEMLRYRLPSATLVAMAQPPLRNKFAFDVHLPLPLEPEQLQAMMREIADQLVGHVLQVGSIRLNVATRTVYTPNGQHHMTPKQSALLQFLMAHVNEVVSRGDIMEAVWETDYLEDTRTLDVHVRWLRECIEPDPSNPISLLTVRGKGYTLQV